MSDHPAKGFSGNEARVDFGGEPDAPPPAGPPMGVVPGGTGGVGGPEHLEDRVAAAVRAELDHAMMALTALRNEVAAISGGLRRVEERLSLLQGGGAAPSAASASGAPRGAEVTERPEGDAGTGLVEFERRIRDVNDRVAQDILDAILAVAQHLEAVQPATSWTLMQELRTQ